VLEIDKTEYLRLIEPLLDRIQYPIQQSLRDAKLKPDDLDDVLLVGGATRMPCIRTAAAKLLRRMPSVKVDPDVIVALGTGIQAGIKDRDKALEDVVLTDVCPYSLGVGVQNDSDRAGAQGLLFAPIIERNSVVPTSKIERFWTTEDNQSCINIGIYQGESRLVKNNIKLGDIKGVVPKAKKGVECIDVRFSFDVNGLLEVDITVLSSGARYYHMVQNAIGNLAKDELERSKSKLARLKFHPKSDEMNLMLIARGERLYESRLREDREYIGRMLNIFESDLDTQDQQLISESRVEFMEFLDIQEREGVF
jgi:molecular chaperone HscC